MKTFLDLLSWGPGFWDSGTGDLLMQYPHHPTNKNLSEAFVNFLLHLGPQDLIKQWWVTFWEASCDNSHLSRGDLRLSEGSSSCSDLISLPGEMVLFLLLAVLLFPTGEAGEWWSHPQRPRPTPHGQTCLDATLMHTLALVHVRKFLNSGWIFSKTSNLGPISALQPSPPWAQRVVCYLTFRENHRGPWGQATLPFSTWHLFNTMFQRTFSAVWVSSCVRTLCWQQLTAWEDEEQCPGPHPLLTP